MTTVGPRPGNEPLSPPDSAAVLDLVAAVNAVSTFEEFTTVALDGLLRLIPSLSASYNELDADGQRVRAQVVPHPGDAVMAEMEPILAELLAQHPLFDWYYTTGDTQALMWSDVITLDEMRRRELFQRMFEPLGVSSQLIVTLPAPAGIVIGLVLNRGPEGFSERDRRVLNTLRPHMVNAYRSVQATTGTRRLQSVLEADGWATLLVADNGTLVDASTGATEAASAYGLELELGRPLPAALRRPLADRLADYDHSHLASPSGPVQVSVGPDGLTAWVVPSPVPPHVVLLRGSSAPLDVSRLAAEGFTARQIDVAAELLVGGTNRQIADRLGIAEGTLKKHLERIYAAVGADNRTSAAAGIRALLA